MKYKSHILICILCLALIMSLIIYFKVEASTKLQGIENFPESYKPYLTELIKKHPNWKFTALYTNLDWNYVIDQENEFGKNLVPKNYSDSWKNTTPGQYNVEVDSGWVDSSRQAVEYCMDPRNFLNEVRIFQFEALSYDQTTNSAEGIEKILYGTEFYNTKVTYLTSNGTSVEMNEKYSDLILKAGKTSYVSAYHLASRIKQEVGPFLSHSSISGKVAGFEGLYNFYNIGATSSSEPMGAIKNGLQYAKDGKGASQETKNKYLIPWNTKERAITGGGIFIGESYINVGQNTVYLQKFDVNDDRGTPLFWHQYMTNVLAPYSESKLIYQGYQKNGLLDTSINFIIPVYNNMPEIQTQSPAIATTDFKQDNTKVYCNASNVNIRSGPGTSYEILTQVTTNDKMTRIAKGVQAGERWDKVKLENGLIGYIFQNYVTDLPPVQIEKIELSLENAILQKGETKQLQVTILPQEASDHKVIYKSSNTQVATVDNMGNITAIKEGEAIIQVIAEENSKIQAQCKLTVVRKLEDSEIHFDSSLSVNGTEISGLDYSNNTVENLKQKITTDLELQFVNNKGDILGEEDVIGTGSKIQVKENGNILLEYTIILYGDVNGDGKITSVDLLVLQRHILEIEPLEEIYTKAANIRKTASKPTSVDLLLIQRHILGLQIIEQ